MGENFRGRQETWSSKNLSGSRSSRNGPGAGGAQAFMIELRKAIKKYARRKPEQVKPALDEIKAALLKQPAIARYVGDFFPAQVEQVYVEMGGKPFQMKTAVIEIHRQHAQQHGKDVAGRVNWVN